MTGGNWTVLNTAASLAAALGLVLIGHRHLGRWVLRRVDAVLCRWVNETDG